MGTYSVTDMLVKYAKFNIELSSTLRLAVATVRCHFVLCVNVFYLLPPWRLHVDRTACRTSSGLYFMLMAAGHIVGNSCKTFTFM